MTGTELATAARPDTGAGLQPRTGDHVTAYFGRVLPQLRIRIGSRTSPMAMAQAEHVRELLLKHVESLQVELVGIQTSGDRWQGDLAELGGKGAFLKEIDRHLLLGEVDIAVHCMKDVPGDVPLPEGTAFAAYLPREDVHDVVVFPSGSPTRPWATCRIGQVLPFDVMCPAVGAGVIGIQCRTADTGIAELLRLLDDAETRTRVTAERTMLHGLQGHCNSPIAGHCTTTPDGQLSLIGMVFTCEGGQFAYAHEWDTPDRAPELGAIVAATPARKGARRIIAGIPH